MVILQKYWIWLLALWYFFLRKPTVTNTGYGVPANTGGSIIPNSGTGTTGSGSANTGTTTTNGVTISQAKADSIAHQLKEELEGWTDPDEIKKILNPLNQNDFLAVKLSFGLKDPGPGYDELDLVQWIIEDASDILPWLKTKFPSVF